MYQLLCPFCFSQGGTKEGYIPFVLFRSFQFDVQYGDTELLQRSTEGIPHKGLQDDQVRRRRDNLFGADVTFKEGLFAEPWIQGLRKAAGSLADAADAYDSVGNTGESIEYIGDHQNGSAGGDYPLWVRRYLDRSIQCVDDGPFLSCCQRQHGCTQKNYCHGCCNQ